MTPSKSASAKRASLCAVVSRSTRVRFAPRARMGASRVGVRGPHRAAACPGAWAGPPTAATWCVSALAMRPARGGAAPDPPAADRPAAGRLAINDRMRSTVACSRWTPKAPPHVTELWTRGDGALSDRLEVKPHPTPTSDVLTLTKQRTSRRRSCPNVQHVALNARLMEIAEGAERCWLASGPASSPTPTGGHTLASSYPQASASARVTARASGDSPATRLLVVLADPSARGG